MQFDLATILSVITGYNLTPFGNVCRLMDYMTGDSLTDLGRVCMQPACKAALLKQFPALADIEPTDEEAASWRGSFETAATWVKESTMGMPQIIEIAPMAVDDAPAMASACATAP